MRYPVYIHSEDGISGYGVIVPDLLGCVSHGDTVEEAFAMAQEAVRFHVDTMVEDGDQLPEPRRIDQIVANDDLADYQAGRGFWAFVETEAPVGMAEANP